MTSSYRVLVIPFSGHTVLTRLAQLDITEVHVNGCFMPGPALPTLRHTNDPHNEHVELSHEPNLHYHKV